MVDMSSPYRYTQPEVARNGGIPVFVQERIEERLKKRSDVDIKVPNDDVSAGSMFLPTDVLSMPK